MEYYYKHWKDAGRHWDKIFENRWPNFSIKEIAQHGPGHERGDTPVVIMPDTLDRLQLLRNYCGFGLRLTSAYRSPEYNDQVSSTTDTMSECITSDEPADRVCDPSDHGYNSADRGPDIAG